MQRHWMAATLSSVANGRLAWLAERPPLPRLRNVNIPAT